MELHASSNSVELLDGEAVQIQADGLREILHHILGVPSQLLAACHDLLLFRCELLGGERRLPVREGAQNQVCGLKSSVRHAGLLPTQGSRQAKFVTCTAPLKGTHGLEADATTRNHEAADEENPYIMVGGDDVSDAEDAGKSDLPQLADAPLGLTYMPGKAASSSGTRPSRRRPRTANRPLRE